MCEYDQSHVYKMDHAKSSPGSVYIFNNQKFDDDPDNEIFRHGSEKDVESLTKLFEEMGFGVECFIDKTEAELDNSIDKIKKTSFEKIDSLIFFIMSYGTEKVIMTKDKKLKKIEDFIRPFKGKRSLVRKPKLFFIQSITEDKNDLMANGCFLKIFKKSQKTFEVPIYADLLIVHSSIDQNINDKDFGCWFIQNLCDVIRIHNQTENILNMMNRINDHVERIPGRNIAPEITNYLTKDFFFPKPIKVKKKYFKICFNTI
jgi:hypothetical protein